MSFGRFRNSHRFGREQESRATKYLRARGLRLLDCNFHSRYGEIDLIMIEGSTLVFIEVRYRGGSQYGSAFETVTAGKQRRIRHTAAHYLQRHSQYQHLNCRFDVIGLSGETPSADPVIRWVKNAFT